MFSRLERAKTEITIKITKRTGISITTEMCCDTIKKYTTKKLQEFLKEHQRNREKAKSQINKFLVQFFYHQPITKIVKLINGMAGIVLTKNGR